MIMGYDDWGKHVKLCHMDLRGILMSRNRRVLNDPSKRYNWGKKAGGFGPLKNWPYSLETDNGHHPFEPVTYRYAPARRT